MCYVSAASRAEGDQKAGDGYGASNSAVYLQDTRLPVAVRRWRLIGAVVANGGGGGTSQ